MIFIYTTATTEQKAKELARALVERKWAVAVNFWPTRSVYLARGEVREGEGVVLFIRTLEKHLQSIEDFLAESHLGGTPCVASVNVYRINRPYKEHVVGHIG